MAGGDATHKGIMFQDQVAAWFAVHALANQAVNEIIDGQNNIPIFIGLESNSPVDDVLVRTNGGGYLFVNVKTTVNLSDLITSPLASVIDQFVRQLLASKNGSGSQGWDRALDPTTDRLVLAIGNEGRASFFTPVTSVLGRIRDAKSITPKDQIARTEREGEILDKLIRLVNHFWKSHTGTVPTLDEIALLLSFVRVVCFDFEGYSKTVVLTLLERSIISNPSQNLDAWTYLIQACHDFGKRRSGEDQAGFREILRRNKINLQESPEFKSDIIRLKAITQETLIGLEHYARLNVPFETGVKQIEIPRHCIDTIEAEAAFNSFLVIGEPGAGKSGALYVSARRLISSGFPVIVLAVDQYSSVSLDGLSQELQLQNRLIDILKSWTTDKPGILIIDALDASRGGPSDKAFQDLIRRAIDKNVGWNVVASIRKFDLRYGVIYQDLFRGIPLSSSFIDNEFSKVCHININRLNDNELSHIWAESPEMERVYLNGSPPFKDLLKSPFNLFLLAIILDLSDTQHQLDTISTQVELLDRYWKYRVHGMDDTKWISRRMLLRAIASQMIDKHELFIEEKFIEAIDREPLAQLLLDGVLTTPNEKSQRISFSHHMLFDYAVARLILMNEQPADLVEYLTLSDDKALLLSPAAMMSLRVVWDEDASRRKFWKIACSIAESENCGSFSKMLAARVAAQVVIQPSDFIPIYESFDPKNSKNRNAALFLIRHVFGALLAGVVTDRPAFGDTSDPWCKVAYELCSLAMSDLIWPMKAVVGRWVSDPTKLSDSQKNDLNFCARLMLNSSLPDSEHPDRYDDGAVISSIQCLARTFEVAPEETAVALRSLLIPEHVNKYGYRELSWLCHEFRYLLKSAPEVLADIYRTVYSTPLPSRDEITSMGSGRILQLTSNKRQDFESARYELERKVVHFLLTYPRIAAQAIIDSINYFIPSEHSVSADSPFEEFVYNGQHIILRSDYSCIWWQNRTRGSQENRSLLDGLVKALIELGDTDRTGDICSIVETIVERNVWASVWTALLRACNERPEKLKQFALPLITSSVVLTNMDTSYISGEVVSKLHAILSENERRDVENAILAIDKNERQKVLLGNIRIEDMVVDQAKIIRSSLETEGIPENRPPYSLEVSSGPAGEWWYREAGIDVSEEPLATIDAAIKVLESLSPPESDDLLLNYMHEHWTEVLKLYDLLLSHPDVHERIRMTGWDKIAEACEKTAKSCRNPADLSRFSNIETIVTSALANDLWPIPSYDAEREASFERSVSWGRPAPRIGASSALMFIYRAIGQRSEDIASKIELLASDPSVEVRHVVLSLVNVLYESDPDLMRQLCERTFHSENNKGVLTFFLSSFYRTIGMYPEWALDEILALDKKFSEVRNVDRRDFNHVIVTIVLNLWLINDQEKAKQRIHNWLDDPACNREKIQELLMNLRKTLRLGAVGDSDSRDSIIRCRAIDILHQAVTGAAEIFHSLIQLKERSEFEQQQLEAVLRVLDSAATEIYFGSGAYKRSNSKDNFDEITDKQTSKRFLVEMKGVIECLTSIPYPTVTHHILQTLENFISEDPQLVFQLVLKSLLEGGQEGGYSFESLGAELVVKIVRRFLADHASMIAGSSEYRTCLMKALDRFAEVGWPDARQLVYELPEMLR